MFRVSLELWLCILLFLLIVAMVSQACGQWVLANRVVEAAGPPPTLLEDKGLDSAANRLGMSREGNRWTWAATFGPEVPRQGVDYGCFDKPTGRECYTTDDLTADAVLEPGLVVIGSSLTPDRPQVLQAGHQVETVLRVWMGCESASRLRRGEAPQDIRGGEGNRMLGAAQLDERWVGWPGWGRAEHDLGQTLDIHQEYDRLVFSLWLVERSGVAQNWRYCFEVAPPWSAGSDQGIAQYARWGEGL